MPLFLGDSRERFSLEHRFNAVFGHLRRVVSELEGSGFDVLTGLVLANQDRRAALTSPRCSRLHQDDRRLDDDFAEVNTYANVQHRQRPHPKALAIVVLVEPTISSNGTLGSDYAVAYDGVNGRAVPPLVRFRTFLRDRDQPCRIIALKTSFPRLWICSFGVEGPTCSLKANLFIISRSLINDSFHLNSGLSTQLARDIRDRPPPTYRVMIFRSNRRSCR
jgi:hypothetical protein